ncbi:hypothetical protein CSB37_01690 [bacterium DOLZORAL124_38_8]|nr:MAG: hypothetical protein CSB37_01690 [bacterium DOLZORAL124_38_8]
MKTIEAMRANCKAMDEIFLSVEKDFKEIEKMSQKLESFAQKMEVLEKFYFEGDWQKERAKLAEVNQDNFACLSEDGIWNLSGSYREEKIKLIKQLVQSL